MDEFFNELRVLLRRNLFGGWQELIIFLVFDTGQLVVLGYSGWGVGLELVY